MVRILIADDDVLICETIAKILKQSTFGEYVEMVHNGQEALNKIQTEHFDLLILDNSMPGLEGLDVIEKLWQNNSELPVLFISGMMDMEPVTQALGMGVKHILAKPFSARELLAKVSSILK